MLEAEKGHHFDGTVVEALVKVLREGRIGLPSA